MAKAKSLDSRKEYVALLRKHFGPGWRPNWPVTTQLALGDVGIIEEGVFVRRDSLKDFDVAFSSSKGGKASSFRTHSSSGVSITEKTKGEVVPGFKFLGEADAGFLVAFSTAGAVVVAADNCRELRVLAQTQLFKSLWKLKDEGIWQKKWVVVTELISSSNATVLSSSTGNTSFEIGAKAMARVAHLSLAGLGTTLTVQSPKSLSTEVIAQNGLTLAYKTTELHKPIFFGSKGGRTRAPARKAAKKRAPAKKAAKKRAPARKAAR
jgi:hypothetical protein